DVPFVLKLSDPPAIASGEGPRPVEAQSTEVRVDRGNLFEQKHRLRIALIRLDIGPMSGLELLDDGALFVAAVRRARVEHVLLSVIEHSSESLLLAVEVGVERARGALGLFGDVGQPRIDEAITFEHDSGGGDQSRPSAGSPRGRRGIAQ